MFKKKIVTLLCGAVMISGLVIGCDSSNSSESKTSKITISGSTSVGPTMEVLAQEYEKNNDVKILLKQADERVQYIKNAGKQIALAVIQIGNEFQ